MKRRSLLLLGALSPIALFTSRYLGAKTGKAPLPTDYRQLAEELNRFASTIQTPSDARRFVDLLADLFSKDAPSAWTRSALRNRVAQAEFAAVSDPQRAIPESRLAEAWNSYVDTLGAPEDQKVTPAELHNLRDEFLTTARFGWNSGSRNFWLVPSIYATLPDGRLAPVAGQWNRFACFGISLTCPKISKRPAIAKARGYSLQISTAPHRDHRGPP